MQPAILSFRLDWVSIWLYVAFKLFWPGILSRVLSVLRLSFSICCSARPRISGRGRLCSRECTPSRVRDTVSAEGPFAHCTHTSLKALHSRLITCHAEFQQHYLHISSHQLPSQLCQTEEQPFAEISFMPQHAHAHSHFKHRQSLTLVPHSWLLLTAYNPHTTEGASIVRSIELVPMVAIRNLLYYRRN